MAKTTKSRNKVTKKKRDSVVSNINVSASENNAANTVLRNNKKSPRHKVSKDVKKIKLKVEEHAISKSKQLLAKMELNKRKKQTSRPRKKLINENSEYLTSLQTKYVTPTFSLLNSSDEFIPTELPIHSVSPVPVSNKGNIQYTFPYIEIEDQSIKSFVTSKPVAGKSNLKTAVKRRSSYSEDYKTNGSPSKKRSKINDNCEVIVLNDTVDLVKDVENNSDSSTDSRKTICYEVPEPSTSKSKFRKSRAFSPLPSTSKDMDVITKNDKRFEESFNGGNSSDNSCDSTNPRSPVSVPDPIQDGNFDTIYSATGKHNSPVNNQSMTDNAYDDDSLELLDMVMPCETILTEIQNSNSSSFHNDVFRPDSDGTTGVDSKIEEISNNIADVKNTIEHSFSFAPKITIVPPSSPAEVNCDSPSTSSVQVSPSIANDTSKERTVPPSFLPYSTDILFSILKSFFERNSEDPMLNMTNNVSNNSKVSDLAKKRRNRNLCNKNKSQTNNLPILESVDLVNVPPCSSYQLSDDVIVLNSDNDEEQNPNSNSLGNKRKKRRKIGPAITEIIPPPTPRTSNQGLFNCPICMENLSNRPIASTLCGHIFCMECIESSIKAIGKKCPTCRKAFNKRGQCYHQLFL